MCMRAAAGPIVRGSLCVPLAPERSRKSHENLLPHAPGLCRPLSELPDPTALAGRLRPPSPDANLESSLQTANPYVPVPRSSAAPIAEPAQHRTTSVLL